MSSNPDHPDARAGAPAPRPGSRWAGGEEPRPSERAPYTFDPHRTERLRSHVAD